jgi:hypothetical protein
VITRRQAMKLASAIAAGKIALPAATEAAPIFQPARYAHQLSGYVAYEMDEHLDHGALTFMAPVEEAEFNSAERAVFEAVPSLKSAPFDHPIRKLQEVAIVWANQIYVVGVQHGAAYESLRRELIGPVGECPQCWGYGLIATDGGWATGGQSGTLCTLCNGAGSAPTAVIETFPKRLVTEN